MSEELYGIDDVESCVRKIESASDNYAKMEVFEQFGVGWGDRKKALWALIRHGHYEAWNDPAIWYELADSVDLASAEDIVGFLEHVERYDAEASDSDGGDQYDAGYDDYGYDDYGYDDYGGYEEPAYESPRLVSFWPQYLDDLAMHAYAADPDLVESRLAEFHPDVQKGLALVKKRFGTLDGDVPEETLTELARTHVWGSLPWRIWDVEDGGLVELILGNSDEEGPANQKRFIGYFADEEAWANAVLESIFSEDYGPNFSATLPAWSVANLEQVEWMLDQISIYNQDRVTAYDLLSSREDSVEDLLSVAASLAENNQAGAAEMAAVAAVRRATDAGEEPPADALQYITFQSIDSPYKRTDFSGLEYLNDALQAFGVDAVRPRFEAAFDHDYQKLAPMPALMAFPDDEALLERAFETVETFAAGDGRRFSSMNKAALGLGLFGPGALEPLAAALEASEVPLARDTFRRAIIGVLADAEEAQDEKYDQYVTLNFDAPLEQTNEHDLGHYVAPDYRAALANMGEERASMRVAEDLDADRPNWHRALAALPSMPTPELLDRAFGVIARAGLPPSEGFNWFQPLLYELREEITPYVGPALAASDSPDFHNAIKQQFGEEQYQQMLDAAGGETAADAGQAGKIARLANAWFEANPDANRTVIYVMERGDEVPEDDTLNRIGGRPSGVTAESWPSRDADSPMQHMLTIDLDTMPSYHSLYKEEVRAFSLYVHSPHHNKAWTPGNSDAEVVTIMRDDAAEYEGELPVGDESAVGFTVEEVEVPVDAFTVPYDGDPELRQIRSAIYSASAWGGGAGPIWLQGDEYFGAFVMQFDEGFVHMNLGDCGIMYVFADTAFWQCH